MIDVSVPCDFSSNLLRIKRFTVWALIIPFSFFLSDQEGLSIERVKMTMENLVYVGK